LECLRNNRRSLRVVAQIATGAGADVSLRHALDAVTDPVLSSILKGTGFGAPRGDELMVSAPSWYPSRKISASVSLTATSTCSVAPTDGSRENASAAAVANGAHCSITNAKKNPARGWYGALAIARAKSSLIPSVTRSRTQLLLFPRKLIRVRNPEACPAKHYFLGATVLSGEPCGDAVRLARNRPRTGLYQTIEPVCGTPERKLEIGQQRLAPETQPSRAENLEIPEQRLGRASLTRGNVGGGE
jgi:hypothetical protein